MDELGVRTIRSVAEWLRTVELLGLKTPFPVPSEAHIRATVEMGAWIQSVVGLATVNRINRIVIAPTDPERVSVYGAPQAFVSDMTPFGLNVSGQFSLPIVRHQKGALMPAISGPNRAACSRVGTTGTFSPRQDESLVVAYLLKLQAIERTELTVEYPIIQLQNLVMRGFVAGNFDIMKIQDDYNARVATGSVNAPANAIKKSAKFPALIIRLHYSVDGDLKRGVALLSPVGPIILGNMYTTKVAATIAAVLLPSIYVYYSPLAPPQSQEAVAKKRKKRG